MVEVKDPTLDRLFRLMMYVDFEKDSYFASRLTYAVDPSKFYVIPIYFLYNQYPLNRACRPFRAESLYIGTIVVYESEFPELHRHYQVRELGSRIRGKIVKINQEQRCRMYALDHGFYEDDVCVERMFYPVHKDTETTPPLAIHCGLDKCQPKNNTSFTEAAIETFKQLIENKKLGIVVQSLFRGKIQVLIYGDGHIDIATALSQAGHTYLADPKLSARPLLGRALTYKHRQLCVGQTIPVRVQSGYSLDSFYVAPQNAFSEYMQSHVEFNNYCESITEISLDQFVPGKVVGVKNEILPHFERAIILAITEPKAKAKVKLVDWGNELEVPKSRLRAIKTASFTQAPACALYCAVVPGFKAWNNGLGTLLYKGYKFSITIKKVGKGFETTHKVMLGCLE